ncbi:MAG: hypothetical protein M1497_00800 [Nitrospirae bacterium]|nr:hypothetical protein [Nitrospirota bacterium]
MCENPANSREHVPPKNLFPESRDMRGENYRVNLITVPSCELHNLSKSKDDEFLMVSLAGIIGNNSIGYRHKLGKVDRAIRRTSYRLLDAVLTKKREIHRIEMAENKFIDVIWGTPDAKRLMKCFDHIARGVHVNHFNSRFDGRVHVHLGFLTYNKGNPQAWNDFVRRKTEIELDGKPSYGANPDVFFYQVTDVDEFGLFLFRFCFYGGLNIYTAMWPTTSSPPNNFAIDLMNRGIKTIVSLGDKKYEFN